MPKTKTSKFRPFEQARELIRGLGLSNREEFFTWAKTSEKPADIPSSPVDVYSTQWKGWRDWLGDKKKEIKQPKQPKYISFQQARDLVVSLKFQSYLDFLTWVADEGANLRIPTHPQATYRGEWIDKDDWIGKESSKEKPPRFRSFDEARNFARSLGLETAKEWSQWANTDQRPKDIPKAPNRVYEGHWDRWGDWLGTDNVSTTRRKYKSFDEAREFARTLGLKTYKEWKSWSKTGNVPKDIPIAPAVVYSEDWDGWGDWLGSGRLSNSKRDFLPFADARKIARSLMLSGNKAWDEWHRLHKPNNLPAAPHHYYEKEWLSWGDWLGTYSVWTKNALIGFIKSLYPILPNLEPSELYSILRNNNCLNAIEQLGEDSPLRQLIDSTLHGHLENNAEIFKEIERLEKQAKGNDEEILNLDVPKNISESEIFKEIIPTEDDVDELPSLTPSHVLENLDHLENVLGISDEDTVEFLINKAIGRIWGKVLRSPKPDIEIEKIREHAGATHSSVVRDRYLEQYSGASSLPIPAGYAFKKNGELLKPNLMQRLVAYRVLKEYRIGNWSGTGAGKTLGAILASRVIDAKLTVIIGLNNTILDEKSGWAAEIRNAFPGSNILIKEKRDIQFSDSQPNYLLLNYEAFQQNDSRDLVHAIIDNYKIDLIVLDEIHSAKSKQNQDESKRRQLINYLLQRAKEINPEVRVLGMSATPVLNSLDEAVSLIEMIKGREYAELETSPKLSNALAIHEQLVINGIRYMPNYAMELKEHPIEIADNSIIENLFRAGKGQILQIEATLLQAKLNAIIALCKPGTIIYSIYVESIFDELGKAIKAAGMSFGIFNGDDKTGLDNFKAGKVDVLLGSSALGTGVDGLQYVCNRLIIVCLPWTSAAYEQLIGRIYRQGSVFSEVDIFIPQITLVNNGESWSWDKQRLARIKYKKTLADAAVDGNVPEANLASQGAMMAEARNALKDWITRLESGEIRQLNRAELKVPLPPEIERRALGRYGDFSAMNQRFNTSKSSTSHQRLVKDPEEFYLYHTLYRKARETWTEIPFQVMAEQVNKRPDWVVGDFGCGEALLSKSVRNKVYSFDHVAVNPSVVACDMSNTGLEGEILDVAIFSLSLMGVNWEDYLKEAFRMLRPGGLIKISEPASAWDKNNFNELKKGIESAGFQLLGDGKLSSKFVYFDAAKPL